MLKESIPQHNPATTMLCMCELLAYVLQESKLINFMQINGMLSMLTGKINTGL